MATYKARYKCRLCGQVFHNGAETGKENAELCLAGLHVGVRCIVPNAPNMTDTHHCGGEHAGSLGLADFQGWKKEE